MSADFAIPGLMPLTSPNVETEAAMPLVLDAHSLSNTLWKGIPSVGPWLVEDETPEYPAVAVTLVLSCPSWPCVIYTLDATGDAEGAMEILDAALWWFSVPEQVLPLYPGIWDWIIRGADTQGNVRVISRGVLPITL